MISTPERHAPAPAPARIEAPRWGGIDAKILERLAKLGEQLDRVELAVLQLIEVREERDEEAEANRPRVVYTVAELTAVLGLRVKQVNNLCRSGRLAARKIEQGGRGKWIVDHAEVERFRAEGPRTA